MPGIGGGLGGAVGIAAESTYGTWAAPTRWIEPHSFKMQEQVHTIQGTGLASGRIVDPGPRRRVTYQDASGTMEYEFLNKGMALLVANIFGTSAMLQQIGTTAAYQLGGASGFSLGAPDNQNYLSMQSLVPDTSGTIHQENFHGCKIKSAEFMIDLQSPLTVTLDIDAQQVTTSEAAGTPSYSPNTSDFTFTGMNFNVGALGSEAAIDGVKKMTCKIERGLETNRIYMGATGTPTKSEPITNAIVKITGTADVDLTAANKPVLWDLYHSQAAVPSIVMQFTGNAIGSSGSVDTFTINPTDVYIDSGGTPELDGPGIVTATLNWTALIDAANDSPLKGALITADSTF